MAERLNRDKVIASAADLADEIGFHNLTITKLGRSLGIAPPGVYRHVRDLSELQRAISRLAAQEAAIVLSSACAGLSGARALEALAVTFRAWAKEHPGRYVALLIAPDPDDAEGQASAEPILLVISSILRAYKLEDDELIDAVRIVRSALHGFISLELSGGFKLARSLDATLSRLISFLDTALSNWGE